MKAYILSFLFFLTIPYYILIIYLYISFKIDLLISFKYTSIYLFKMASNKEQTFLNAAFNQALLSPCQMRHGCVVVANGRILGKGYNHYRTKSSDKIINGCSCHAEMAALRDCTRHYTTNKKQHYLLQLKVAKNQACAFQAHRLCC